MMEEIPTPRTTKLAAELAADDSLTAIECLCLMTAHSDMLEREQAALRVELDRQVSVTLGQIQTIRELRADLIGAQPASNLEQPSLAAPG